MSRSRRSKPVAGEDTAPRGGNSMRLASPFIREMVNSRACAAQLQIYNQVHGPRGLK